MSHRSPIAGFLALAAVYATAGVLAVVPTPWTKVGAAGLMAIPDAVVFGAGYSMGRDWGHSTPQETAAIYGCDSSPKADWC